VATGGKSTAAKGRVLQEEQEEKGLGGKQRIREGVQKATGAAAAAGRGGGRRGEAGGDGSHFVDFKTDAFLTELAAVLGVSNTAPGSSSTRTKSKQQVASAGDALGGSLEELQRLQQQLEGLLAGGFASGGSGEEFLEAAAGANAAADDDDDEGDDDEGSDCSSSSEGSSFYEPGEESSGDEGEGEQQQQGLGKRTSLKGEEVAGRNRQGSGREDGVVGSAVAADSGVAAPIAAGGIAGGGTAATVGGGGGRGSSRVQANGGAVRPSRTAASCTAGPPTVTLCSGDRGEGRSHANSGGLGTSHNAAPSAQWEVLTETDSDDDGGDDDDDDGFSDTASEGSSIGGEDEEFLQLYGQVLEQELAGSNMELSFERMQIQRGKGGSAEAVEGADGGSGEMPGRAAAAAAGTVAGISGHLQGLSTGDGVPSGRWEGQKQEVVGSAAAPAGAGGGIRGGEGLMPVDLDMNLVKSLMASYTTQGGMPGPASNLAGLLGVQLPTTVVEERDL
jgi:hypothetical protein